jgi:creatinine amidohydrolase
MCSAQSLSAHWEELTSSDFQKALVKAKNTCILAGGILEKHGPTGPLGTDMFNTRNAVDLATQKEYAIIFPEYYVGQIVEAQQQPGTISYSMETQLMMLDETTKEMARNGCKKIIIQGIHGRDLVPTFVMSQLDSPRDYVVYTITGTPGENAIPPSKPDANGHGGEAEMSRVMAWRPELVKPERAGEESYKAMGRLNALPPYLFTAIWWYADFPNHYAGDAANATAARGQAMVDLQVKSIAESLKAIKDDQVTPQLQKEFFEKRNHPTLGAATSKAVAAAPATRN